MGYQLIPIPNRVEIKCEAISFLQGGGFYFDRWQSILIIKLYSLLATRLIRQDLTFYTNNRQLQLLSLH